MLFNINIKFILYITKMFQVPQINYFRSLLKIINQNQLLHMQIEDGQLETYIKL